MTDAYRLAGVSVRYGDRMALDAVDLAIAADAVTAVTGPNGAGKSTLLRVLAFLERPTAGEIRYFGTTAGADAAPTLRRRVGLVQQNPLLLRGSVAANVELGLKLRRVPRVERRARVQDTLRQLDLERLADADARRLSGGEAQRVAVARILVLEPEVLLLDEPFTHLDHASMAVLEALLATIAEHRAQTVVFSTHDARRAQALAGRIVHLRAGRLAPPHLGNVFSGRLDTGRALFDTGRLCIHVADDVAAGTHLAIEPAHVVLSRAPLVSSMRNSFRGRIVELYEAEGDVHVVVDAGERLHAVITHDALAAERYALGETVWVSFKSTAAQVF